MEKDSEEYKSNIDLYVTDKTTGRRWVHENVHPSYIEWIRLNQNLSVEVIHTSSKRNEVKSDVRSE